MGIQQVLSAPRSPWQRAYVKRVVATIRRECLDPMIAFGEGSLYRHLQNFINYSHRSRTHLALAKDSPEPRPVQPPGAGRTRFRRWVGSIIVTSGAPPERQTQLISTAAVFAPSSPCLQPRMATYPVPSGSAICSEDHR
jgi:hypothetical protein